MSDRLPAYYYCTPEEIAALGIEEPGVPADADLTDPRILIQPTLLANPASLPDADLIDPPLPAPGDPDAPVSAPPLKVRGWTPENQSRFIQAIGEGYTVEASCRMVGLTVQAAYKFRRRAAGMAFALGWDAARLLARDKLADTLVSRIYDGQVETITRDGIEITRHRYDNRLAMATLTRLDRFAEKQEAAGVHQAARLIAQDFEAYLDIIQKDGSCARAGLFLARRMPADGLDGDADDQAMPLLHPLVALSNADRFQRTGAALACEIDIADLDYAQRADWTADQWQRADAAGLLAPSLPKEGIGGGSVREHEDADWHDDPETHSPHDGNTELPKPKPPRSHGTGLVDRVWYDPYEDALLTNFPPPPDFIEYENFHWGHPDYERALTPDEEELIEARRAEQIAEISADDAALRDRWFESRGDGDGDVLGIYEIAVETGEAEQDEDTIEMASDADDDPLPPELENDPRVKLDRDIQAGFEGLERGDNTPALDAIEHWHDFCAQTGREPPPRRAMPTPNRKARRAAAARQRAKG